MTQPDFERGHGARDTHSPVAPLNTHFDGDQRKLDTRAHRAAVEGNFDQLERGRNHPDAQSIGAPLNPHLGGDQPEDETQGTLVAVEDRQGARREP